MNNCTVLKHNTFQQCTIKVKKEEKNFNLIINCEYKWTLWITTVFVNEKIRKITSQITTDPKKTAIRLELKYHSMKYSKRRRHKTGFSTFTNIIYWSVNWNLVVFIDIVSWNTLFYRQRVIKLVGVVGLHSGIQASTS